MQITFKQILVVATLLVTSVMLIIFVPVDAASSNTEVGSSELFEKQDKLAGPGLNYAGVMLVVLAKEVSAIVVGIFAVFCVCSRIGMCRKKRNRLILGSTQGCKSSATVNVFSGEERPLEIV